MFKRIDHVEIVTGDIEKSLDFYTNVLGFKIKQRQKMSRLPLEEIVYVELNGSVIEFLAVQRSLPGTDRPLADQV